MSLDAKHLNETVNFLKKEFSVVPDTALTLGSGLGDFASELTPLHSLNFSDIPHFLASKVDGHKGCLHLCEYKNKRVAILQGRIHIYEGHSAEQMAFPTQALVHWGVKNFILTNAAGGVDPQMTAGDFMVITDHINFTGRNPLVGLSQPEYGVRFPDMTEIYNRSLGALLKSCLEQEKLRTFEGVYCGVLGPSFETPAEIRFFQKMGVSAVGMSTVNEALAAHAMGARVCGLSCISNKAAGLSENPLSHEEVQEETQKVKQPLSQALKLFIEKIS